jgi:hypothetical protein
MSLWNDFKIAILDYPWALRGEVGPTELGVLNAERDKAIERASGVGVGGKTVVASKEVVTQRKVAAKREVEGYLKSIDAYPSDLLKGIADPLQWLRSNWKSAAILTLSIGLGAYFLVEIGKAYVSRRR